MKILKPKFWDKKNSLWGFFLLPFSLCLQILVSIRNKIIIKKNISIPVVCVGNIYLGGTGKTPLSIKIVKVLEKLNKKGAIIKKSYKKQQDEFKLIRSKQVSLFKNSSRCRASDEAIRNKFDFV